MLLLVKHPLKNLFFIVCPYIFLKTFYAILSAKTVIFAVVDLSSF